MLCSDQRCQYAAGHMVCRYHVVPSSRVLPAGKAVKRNCPFSETKYPCKCGGCMLPYGLSSLSGAGFAVTPNFNSRGSSHASIGSTNGPVEKIHSRTAPTPCPEISARIG